MSKKRGKGFNSDAFKAERLKIQASNILDALIEYAEGHRDMTSSQMSAALGLLKRALPDLSSFALPEIAPHETRDNTNAKIEIHIVDPRR